MKKRLFTWANWSVHGLGRWYTKFRTRKFRPGIAFITKKNGREGLNPVSKMALTKWDAKFRLEYSVRKNRTTFSDVPLLPEIFSGTTQKVVRHLLSKRIFWKILVNGKQTVISIAITWQKTKHTKGCRVQHEDFSPQTMASKGFTLIGPWCSSSEIYYISIPLAQNLLFQT